MPNTKALAGWGRRCRLRREARCFCATFKPSQKVPILACYERMRPRRGAGLDVFAMDSNPNPRRYAI